MWVGIPKNELKQLKRETVPCEFRVVIPKLTSVLYKMIYLFTNLHSMANFYALLFGYVAINSYLCNVIKTAVLSVIAALCGNKISP